MQITVNELGAKTLRDARPMMIEGQKVYVVLGGGTASLIATGTIVAEKAAETMTTYEAQVWAAEYRDSLTAAQADDVEAVYAEAVEQVRSQSAGLRREAERLSGQCEIDQPYVFRNMTGKKVTIPVGDPRHPANAYLSVLREAAVLASWTGEDESGYQRYVSDGLGDTDGYFAPLSRAAWKTAA